MSHPVTDSSESNPQQQLGGSNNNQYLTLQEEVRRPTSPLEGDAGAAGSTEVIDQDQQVDKLQHSSNQQTKSGQLEQQQKLKKGYQYGDEYGEKSLREIHVAALQGNEAYMKDIIQRGANLHVQTMSGETALHIAARHNHDLIVNDLMLNGGVSSIRDKHGRTPLHAACACGAVGAVKVLLNFQADAEAKDINGMSPLHLAAKYNQPKVIDIIGRRKFDLSIRVPSNMHAAIHVAVENGSREAMETLIEYGASPNQRAWSGRAPLHVAVENGQKDLIAPLVSKGAEINQRLTNGRTTPLTLAIERDQLECLEELLRVAKASGKLEEVLGQRTRDAHMWLPIHTAVYSGKKEAVKLLVQAGADYQTQDYYHFSCVHLAAEKDNAEMTQLLLSYGVDPNERRRSDNWSVLHHAASYCSCHAVEVLLKAGANPNLLNNGFVFGFMRQRPLDVVGQNCKDRRKLLATRELLQKYSTRSSTASSSPPYK
eukprot:TRINITY_DN10547_c0_g1_i1.p1 TRINITY_DN10547_c0_g1~~TRINITY_DN10547_c0_g1_i1.p1  ORF type:complete len:484 (-),score=76.64 TRINITY_DN10547_c0_g1_i1:358-1809(-)